MKRRKKKIIKTGITKEEVTIRTIEKLDRVFSISKLLLSSWKTAPSEIIAEILEFLDVRDYSKQEQTEHDKMDVSVDLSRSAVTNEDIVQIADIIKTYNNITYLKIPHAGEPYGDHPLLPLFKALESNTSLKELHIIGKTEVATREYVMYAELSGYSEEDLRANEYYETVYSYLSDKTFNQMIASLKKNRTLKKLVLHDYELGRSAYQPFESMLAQKKRRGDIFECTFGSDKAELEEKKEKTEGPRPEEKLGVSPKPASEESKDRTS